MDEFVTTYKKFIMAPQAMSREQNIKNLKSGLKIFDVMESLAKLNATFY